LINRIFSGKKTAAVGALLLVVDNLSSKTKLVVLLAFTVAASNLAIYPSFELQRIISTFTLPTKLSFFFICVNTILVFGLEKHFTFTKGLKSIALTILPSTVPNSSPANLSSEQDIIRTKKTKLNLIYISFIINDFGFIE
jgi:hypothetical protein